VVQQNRKRLIFVRGQFVFQAYFLVAAGGCGMEYLVLIRFHLSRCSAMYYKVKLVLYNFALVVLEKPAGILPNLLGRWKPGFGIKTLPYK